MGTRERRKGSNEIIVKRVDSKEGFRRRKGSQEAIKHHGSNENIPTTNKKQRIRSNDGYLALTPRTENYLYGGEARKWTEFVREVIHATPKELLREMEVLEEEEEKENERMETKTGLANLKRCRYPEILCWDETRVVLRGSQHFIHANHINGYLQKRHYILTQAPFVTTMDDFWEMVWQEKCAVILMLCALTERKREKCHGYWPTQTQRIMKAGRICVKWERSETIQFGEHKELFELTEITLTRETGEKLRHLRHVQFLGWPDHHVPSFASTAMDLCKEIQMLREEVLEKNNKIQNDLSKGPLVVHCSAGIGRSAAWVSIDIARTALRIRGKVEVPIIVGLLRKQRWGAVQKKVQYLYIYASILSYLQAKRIESDIGVDKILKTYVDYCAKLATA